MDRPWPSNVRPSLVHTTKKYSQRKFRKAEMQLIQETIINQLLEQVEDLPINPDCIYI